MVANLINMYVPQAKYSNWIVFLYRLEYIVVATSVKSCHIVSFILLYLFANKEHHFLFVSRLPTPNDGLLRIICSTTISRIKGTFTS